jgi:hypothetical protein
VKHETEGTRADRRPIPVAVPNDLRRRKRPNRGTGGPCFGSLPHREAPGWVASWADRVTL